MRRDKAQANRAKAADANVAVLAAVGVAVAAGPAAEAAVVFKAAEVRAVAADFNSASGAADGGSRGGTAVDMSLPAERQTVASAGAGKLRFNSRSQPWREVIEWFAAQGGYSLVGDYYNPPGTFNYQSARDEALTPTEALDKLNYVLQTTGYTLIRRDNTLMLVDLSQEIPAGLVPTIELEELEKRGNFEVVNVLFKLSRMTPEEAQAEIAKLQGPRMKADILAKTRQLSVTDNVGRIKTMRGVIDLIENPDAKVAENLQPIAIWSMKTEDALKIVKELLNIPADRSNTTDGSLRIVADPAGRRLLVAGKPDAIKRVEDIVKTIDGRRGGAPVSDPHLVIYPLTGGDPTGVYNVLVTLLAQDAASGMVRLSVDQGRLVAYWRLPTCTTPSVPRSTRCNRMAGNWP